MIFYFLLMAAFAYAYKPCPQVQIEGVPPDFMLSETQMALVCGSKSGPWSNIPLNQARFHLGVQLEALGYLNPEYEIKDNILIAHAGLPVKIRRVTVTGGPPEFHIERYSNLNDGVLTPKKLDQIEGWVRRELGILGYGCATVKINADRKSGDLTIKIDPGQQLLIAEIREEPVSGLREGTLRRYDAIKIGDRLDMRNVTLTERRIIADDIVTEAHFDLQCKNSYAYLTQHATAGPPRTLKAGFGVDTEEGLIARATWHHGRVDDRGTSARVVGESSFLTQRLDARMRWYFLNHPSRTYLTPSFTASRIKDSDLEVVSTQVGFAIGHTWEFSDDHVEADIGPVFRIEKTPVGDAPDTARSLTLTTHGTMTSHDFEYYSAQPRSGVQTSGTVSYSEKGVFSDFEFIRILLTGERLWNVGYFDPPKYVFGFRGQVGTTVTPLSLDHPSEMPSFLRFYLGGSRDIRGFSRRELPISGKGALTSAYAGFEIRKVGFLYDQIQPFLFVDAAELGLEPASLVAPFYWSPGLGIRWESPIGALRILTSHGFVYLPGETTFFNGGHWQFYLAYGEEF